MTTTRPRRARNSGSIFWDASRKRYVALLSVKGEDGTTQRRKFTGRSEQEVSDKLLEAQIQRKETGTVIKARDTLGSLLDEWQRRNYPLTKCRTANTHTGYDWAVNHLRDGLGHIRVSELTADDVEDFLTRKMSGNRPLGDDAVKRLVRILRTALNWGRRAGKVYRNVAMEVVVPDLGHKRPSDAFNAEELTALLTHAQQCDDDAMKWGAGRGGAPMPLFASWYVMGGMGLRPGECFGLTWDAIDFDAPHAKGEGNGVLEIRSALIREVKGGKQSLYLGPLKTSQSHRVLDIPLQVATALKAHRKRQAEHMMEAGTKWDRSSDLVFANDSGGPIDPSATRRRFRKLCALAGVPNPGGRHPHELRHTVASYLSVECELPLDQVSDVLGHRAGTSTTARVYRHRKVRRSVPWLVIHMELILPALRQPVGVSAA